MRLVIIAMLALLFAGPANAHMFDYDGEDCRGQSPIVVSFSKSPEVEFTEPRIVFDLDGDGTPEVISWPIDGGFLVLDRDGDGQITSGKELFGDNTFPGLLNGFDALAYEGKGNAVVDKDNPRYTKVEVWADEDQDGITDPGELRPFSDYIQRLFLFYERSGKKDQHGNTYRWKGEAIYKDGEQRPIYAVCLAKQ
jgi:hypothetical protein